MTLPACHMYTAAVTVFVPRGLSDQHLGYPCFDPYVLLADFWLISGRY
jgi:hypothetical protein